jgi:hypothetical protein
VCTLSIYDSKSSLIFRKPLHFTFRISVCFSHHVSPTVSFERHVNSVVVVVAAAAAAAVEVVVVVIGQIVVELAVIQGLLIDCRKISASAAQKLVRDLVNVLCVSIHL